MRTTNDNTCYNEQPCCKVYIHTQGYRAQSTNMDSSQSINRLCELPTDLIPNVLSGLTIGSLMDLKKAMGDKNKNSDIVLECNKLASVSSYLKTNFGYGTELLTVLSKCFGYISGSRSVEFFVPGSTDESSDLDMYVPNLTNMGKAMRLLAGLGVKWYSVEEDIRECADKGRGNVITGGSCIVMLRKSGALARICRDKNLRLHDNAGPNPQGMLVVFVNQRILTIKYSRMKIGYMESKFDAIVNGRLYHNGRHIRVQLICEKRLSGMMGIDSLEGYHSSCVQSFINGHMACHLYGKMASRKESHGWSANLRDVELIGAHTNRPRVYRIQDHGKLYIVPGWEKYEKRGFRYVRELSATVDLRRTMFDTESILVQYTDEVGAPSRVSQAYLKTAEVSWWRQDECNIYGTWTSTEATEAVNVALEDPWFLSDDIHADQGYLRDYHVAYTSLILDDSEIVAEIE
jgi:hypothetical protein